MDINVPNSPYHKAIVANQANFPKGTVVTDRVSGKSGQVTGYEQYFILVNDADNRELRCLQYNLTVNSPGVGYAVAVEESGIIRKLMP